MKASEAARHAHSVLGPTAEVWTLQARASVGLGRQQDADYEIRQAIDVAGSDGGLLIEIGELYREIGQPNAAQSIFQRAVKSNEAAVRNQANRGIAELHLDAGRFHDATLVFERLAKDTDSPEDRNRLAGVLVARAEETPRVQRGSRYVVTSEHEIRRMRDLLNRAQELSANNKLIAQIEKIERYLLACEKPTRTARTMGAYTAIMAGWLVPAILLSFIVAQASLVMGLIILCSGLGAGTTHVLTEFNAGARPQWSVNERQNASATPRGNVPLLEGPTRWMPRREVTASSRQRAWPQPASRSGY
ncbi:hypothetical protein J4H86_23505 [Spiractinospora alimapuensis]|uniref:tetratricopeptide repeat protein n=1 Tax=Spiractinospora alimapuensis TaxID=2820884 RepID=UPI001F477BC1|nr:hypothetical protein [Spiractinospora alimapuensis]QVQ51703.1 hypothetical protein J4H86_23505 [Spiractinospora alimapuensis]